MTFLTEKEVRSFFMFCEYLQFFCHEKSMLESKNAFYGSENDLAFLGKQVKKNMLRLNVLSQSSRGLNNKCKCGFLRDFFFQSHSFFILFQYVTINWFCESQYLKCNLIFDI